MMTKAEIVDAFSDYGKPDPEIKTWLRGAKILFAEYDLGGYEGFAFIVFEKHGNLYEVNAAHCSCYGLEGQFKPEQTTIESILARREDYGPYPHARDVLSKKRKKR